MEFFSRQILRELMKNNVAFFIAYDGFNLKKINGLMILLAERAKKLRL
jgi:hypothetical protein